jgi:hypothetical protein
MTISANGWLDDLGFQIVSGKDLLISPKVMRDTLGVYMIFLSAADQVFTAAGLSGAEALRSWSVGDFQLVYIGEGIGVRSRAMQHLAGTIRDSSVRESLLSLQFLSSVLWPEGSSSLTELEQRLTSFLIENTYIAFRYGGYVRDAERELIQRTASPFNTVGNSGSPLHSQLKVLRKRFREHLRATGQRHHRASMPASAWLSRANHFAGSPTQSTKPLS